MRILLETKKFSIYYDPNPFRNVTTGKTMFIGYLINIATEEIEEMYQDFEKSRMYTIEKLGKKLYKKAKRIK